MEELDAHKLKLWSSEDNEGPVSGRAGHAHDASQLQEPALGNLKSHRYSVQHSYAKGARDNLYALGIRSSQKVSRVSRVLESDLAGARAKTQP